MGNFASRGPKISSKDKAILELKVQRDKLYQYEKKLEIIIQRELQVAKDQLILGNHHAARLALSKKKYQVKILEKTGLQLINIEQLTQTIEYSLVERDIVQKLKLGNQVLQQIHAELSVEAVEKIMDDTADGIAYQNEIQLIIDQKLNRQDESDVMDELDKLIQSEDEISAKITSNSLAALPNIPKTSLHLTPGSFILISQSYEN